MYPTFPLTTGVLEPLAVAFGLPGGRDTSTTGNDHSNASDAIVPGVWAFPSIVSC
jgi:hypothetical protein